MVRVVPHDFWYRMDVSQDLGCFDLPSVLARVAGLSGWTQDDLARLLDYSRPTLNKIVNGTRPLRIDEAKRIIKILGIPPYLVGVATSDPAEVVGEPGRDRNHTLSQRIRATTIKFSVLERERGGNGLAALLAREVGRVAPVVRESGMPMALAAFGELSALAGYANYDAQRYRLASHYYDVALQAAYESGSSTLAGQVRALMSMKATWLDQPKEGVAHCVVALEANARMPDAVKAMILARQARAEALWGDRERVFRLLDASRSAMPDAEALRSPIAYWSDLEMYGNAGIAYKDIGEFGLAESNLSDAVAVASRNDSRDIVLYLGMLSRLFLKQGREEEAADVIIRILASQVISSRARTQLTLFLAKTTHCTGSAVREVRPRIRAALAV